MALQTSGLHRRVPPVEWPRRRVPWVAVHSRFEKFADELLLSKDQFEDAITKQRGVRQSLERAYYERCTSNPPGLIVGSWGRGTQVKPSSDVDVIFELPVAEKTRFDRYSGNGQSALLQEVKSVLQQTYPGTDMRGDGQVVQVKFNSIMVEVLPAFRSDESHTYVFPDTNDGGSWKSCHPEFEQALFEVRDSESNRNFRRVVRMIKCWKKECNVTFKSFLLEHVIYDFFEKCVWRSYSYLYYDWIIRDFFEFLIKACGSRIWIPNDGNYIGLGAEWLNDAKQAYADALEACDLEYRDLQVSAGLSWQKIFGTRIEVYA